MRYVASLCVLMFCVETQAQSFSDIPLNPGEILLSVNGVPTGNTPPWVLPARVNTEEVLRVEAPVSPDKSVPVPVPDINTDSVTAGPSLLVEPDADVADEIDSPNPGPSVLVPNIDVVAKYRIDDQGRRWAIMTTGRAGVIINKDQAAYDHALREATIIAARGAKYHAAKYGDGGHPLGTAKGCLCSGTGWTRDKNRPGHCYEELLPESRIVARARVQGPNGLWFWAAQYR